MRLRLTWRSWIVILLCAGAAAFALNRYSARSEFCGSCHSVMGAHYVSWSSSTHSSVKCLDCHSDPGWVGYYHSKLDGVRNALQFYLGIDRGPSCPPPGPAACQRPGCHSTQDLVAGGGAGATAHARHLASVACVDCHGDVGHRVVSEQRTVKACDACHDQPLQTP
jgi:nitrate/TMAO reductase-like tetraheme cytochrome c subunit